jgi:hypothetical protein
MVLLRNFALAVGLGGLGKRNVWASPVQTDYFCFVSPSVALFYEI